jgi:hypothetical protein
VTNPERLTRQMQPAVVRDPMNKRIESRKLFHHSLNSMVIFAIECDVVMLIREFACS